ncbi:MAG: NAD(P)-dependent glycerol-3-phosphate dehydrogenase [Rhizobiales bacterium]|nr:NAD(P)-dependent glycerol-3-phosphate dehydrogenase [Hyphomicrobiales bacterium]
MKRRIGIAGAGAWGRALAQVAGLAGHDVSIWPRGHVPKGHLCDAVILAVPAQVAREVLAVIKPAVPTGLPLIIAAKGIEQATGLFMNEVVAEVIPGARAMILSGPGFAADVMRGLPTAVVLAAATLAEASEWAEALTAPSFRIYNSDDVRGVEIGGALKNVLAIACGIADGRGLGDSARAALTTRGFAELMRFGRKLGGKPETLIGLSGLGDLLLTCSSSQSRNYAFGLAIGAGRTVAEAFAQSTGVVEGAFTAQIAFELARKHGIDMPIVDAVHSIVDRNASPDAEIARLLARPVGREMEMT